MRSKTERRRRRIYDETFQALHRLGKVTLDEYFGPPPEGGDEAKWVYLDVSVDHSTPTMTCEPTGLVIELRGDEYRLAKATDGD